MGDNNNDYTGVLRKIEVFFRATGVAAVIGLAAFGADALFKLAKSSGDKDGAVSGSYWPMQPEVRKMLEKYSTVYLRETSAQLIEELEKESPDSKQIQDLARMVKVDAKVYYKHCESRGELENWSYVEPIITGLLSRARTQVMLNLEEAPETKDEGKRILEHIKDYQDEVRELLGRTRSAAPAPAMQR
ncbi:MAG: hypothetical protein COV36_05870 [Alphaproteobacteria bacterium CG11_big_fil_rev_8_21_14_0_20_44_7]|nr:MAG: hypothetical protein COV36_05870 [Alphaproteobacteria bacterium CG11_big_fil_rev_8_21_14_0_20_44_7]